MWILYAICSAICLGFYDIAKKRALEGNAVLYVLSCSVIISSFLLLPMAVASYFWPETLMKTMFFVPQVSLHGHLLILLKAVIVLLSWIFAYYSMKHLPITLVTPISATRPMWTLLGAVLIFGEVLPKSMAKENAEQFSLSVTPVERRRASLGLATHGYWHCLRQLS